MDDCMISSIPSGTVAIYGKKDWGRIRECLNSWENEGFLEILSDPEKTDPKEPCVKIFRYISSRSLHLEFLNYEDL